MKKLFFTLCCLLIIVSEKSFSADFDSIKSTLKNLPRFLTSGKAKEYSVIKCGPVITFEIPNLGTLKVREIYREDKDIYTFYVPYKSLETVAFEANSNGVKLKGVLDFYTTDKKNPIKISLYNQYLEINHLHGTHDVSLIRLFSSPAATYDASRFYSNETPCINEMP